MRTIKMLIVIGMTALLAGCVPSLHPLFTENDPVFEPALVGSWAEKGEKETWAFQKSGDKTYELVHPEREDKAGRFAAHVVQLKKYRFLDIYPEKPVALNEFYRGHFVRTHTFYRLSIEEDVLRLTPLDMDWLGEMIDKKKAKIRYEKVDEGVFFTASTPDLQKFVLKYAEHPRAFREGWELRRQESNGEPQDSGPEPEKRQ